MALHEKSDRDAKKRGGSKKCKKRHGQRGRRSIFEGNVVRAILRPRETIALSMREKPERSSVASVNPYFEAEDRVNGSLPNNEATPGSSA